MAYNFPSNPTLGQVYSFNGRSWKWTGVQWLAINVPTSTSAPVYFSAAPPKNPVSGALWYDTTSETLKIWGYILGDTEAHWRDVICSSPLSPPYSPVIVSSSPPLATQEGTLWYDKINSSLKVLVTTGGGNEWMST